MSGLHQLARAVGLQADWSDAEGRSQRVADDDLARVLDALGYDAQSEADIAASLARRREEERACTFLSVDRGDDLVLAADGDAPGEAELALASGVTLPVTLRPEAGGLRLLTSQVEATGYHRLRLGAREFTLAIAPPRCFAAGDAAPGRRLWGAAVQLPALRDAESTVFGTFGTLAGAARAFAGAGADAVAISPVHALFPADASRFSPYAPSSRLFLNILFGDPRLIGAPAPTGEGGDLIDWERAIPARLEALRAAYAMRGGAVMEALATYRADAGPQLHAHAVFDALHGHFFAQGARGWQDWPRAFHDPDGEAVARFAHEHAAEVEFFVFAQWLARMSLGAGQKAAREAGMALGLIADLAVGMDAGGSHAWSRRDELLTGLSIGAPPDPLGPRGQDWGITGFSPLALRRTGFAGFIDTLRAALAHAGGIRIDHILGLSRLWVIPHGARSAHGAYLTSPLDDMLRILAIESWRARAVVIGEDLGTVPDGLRPRLAARRVAGMSVLWFERDDGGHFIPPRDWRGSAVAMTGTHDLPTVAGWWRGRDIDWAWRLGRSGADSEEADRRQRDIERESLWRAFTASGAADGPPPPPQTPARAIDAAAAHVATTPGALALYPLEDLAGLEEQPNLPGTMDEHPNWRRRMPDTAEALLARADVSRRVAAIDKARR